MQWNRAVPEPEASIKLHEAYHWPVYKLCSAAGISRAGYYKWLSQTASSKQLEDERLAHLIVEIYQNQRGVTGYRQMQIILERRYGVRCNLKRVYRLMRILDLRSVCRRKSERIGRISLRNILRK